MLKTMKVVTVIVAMSWCVLLDHISKGAPTQESAEAAKVLRPDPKPSPNVAYARNLLTNGDVEAGEGDKPAGWTYVGKSDKDWTQEQIDVFHGNGRPESSIGRGKGQWSHDIVYAGKGSLLNESIDPPLSKMHRWYGGNPVEGYWLSDPMPCASGKAYMAGAWIRPGATITECWLGPLEIQFFDKDGKHFPLPKNVRTMLGDFAPNVWRYWFTTPYIAPDGAVTMRLRFGQELSADKGGWGKTYADNLALWEVPPQADLANARFILASNMAARKWFANAHSKTKPPYLPSPAEASEYESIWGEVQNTRPGNVFGDPKAEVKIQFSLFNALGEDRSVLLKGIRTDWKGNASEEFTSSPVLIPGYSQATVEISLPPTGEYGAFYLGCDVTEGSAKVGSCSGRYAVIPPLTRKRTQDNIWAVTLLRWDKGPYDPELGQVLQMAGFGMGWVRDYTQDDPDTDAMHAVQFFRSQGMKVVLQLMPPLRNWSPSDEASFNATPYYEYGRQVAQQYKGLVVAYGDWGVEQANCRTAERSVYRPIRNGKFLSDREYDLISVAIHDGIRSVDKDTPILIGNIATDVNADAIRRIYGPPANGRFDGAILNAYYSLVTVAQNALAEFDKHGDTSKTIWQEENAAQRSPNVGPERRYHEWEGANKLIRNWITLACKTHPRIRAITQWGFVPRNRGDDLADADMMDIGLQPRPHFVAHAIMADALADAQYAGDRSAAGISAFEFKRSDGPLIIAWANQTNTQATFETAGDDLVVTDIMGNSTTVKAVNGTVTLGLTPEAVYLSGVKQIRIKPGN